MKRIFLSTVALLASSTNAWPASGQNVETIVVTASPIVGNPDRFAVTVGVVGRDDILKAGGANLADALANMPGVTGTSFASGASRPVIRGFDASRVRVLEDGIGSFDVSDVGPDHGVPIDPLSAQRIEVVRGAATLRYGSQAIGGVVNAINNRVPLTLPDETFGGEAEASYGTNADLRQGSVLADVQAGPFALHADGFIRRTGDYDTPDGTEQNSFFRGDGYSGGASYFFGDSRIGGAGIHYDAKYGIPGEDTFIDMKQTKWLERSSFAMGDGVLQTVTVDAGYADYNHSERDSQGVALSTFIDKEWDIRSEAVFGPIGPLSASAVGVQVQRRNFSGLGEAANYLLPTVTTSEAAFAFTEAPLSDRLHLQAGARVEQVKVEGTSPVSGLPAAPDFTPVSGSVGVLFDASDAVKFGLTVSSAARAPVQTELYAHGPHDGPATFETGDPNLTIERANSAEASVRLHWDNVRIEGSLWGALFDNYIFGRLTGRTCDDAGNCIPGDSQDLKELFYEQRAARFWGLEAQGTFGLGEVGDGTLSADVLADYVRATLDGGGNVPRIPPYHVGAGLTWVSDKFDAGFMLRYAGAQHLTGATETPTKGFVDLDAQLAWRPFTEHPGIEIAVVGHNLTDAVQRNVVALNHDDVILPGRDVRVVLRAAY
jgi:iron complex outermembrane recepter protein